MHELNIREMRASLGQLDQVTAASVATISPMFCLYTVANAGRSSDYERLMQIAVPHYPTPSLDRRTNTDGGQRQKIDALPAGPRSRANMMLNKKSNPAPATLVVKAAATPSVRLLTKPGTRCKFWRIESIN